MLTEEQKAKRREYKRKYRAEHREERNERIRKRRAEHREERNEQSRKKRAEHREVLRERHRKYRSARREEYNEWRRKYNAQNLNINGVKKSNIRNLSYQYLFRMHSKLQEYEIHHAFGYSDYTKFIYIPKSLHIKIHQLLRDQKIPSDSDHWLAIRELVNSCEQYTYISGGIC